MTFPEIPKELVKGCQRGEESAFEEMYQRIKGALYGFVYSMMRNHDETDEVFQECLIRMYRHISKLKDARKFGWWLRRMAVNQCRTHLTRRGRTESYEYDDAIEVKEEGIAFERSRIADPHECLVRKELGEEINEAISNLPPKQQMAIVLFEVQGYSIRDIAGMMSCTEGAVKFNLHQGRRKLRVSLSNKMRKVTG